MRQGLLSVFTLLFLSATGLKAQAPVNTFSKDSLKGFDERAVIQKLSLRGLSGAALKHNLYIAEKEFIYEKYYHKHNNTPVFKPSGTTIIQPACTNMGFEDPVAFSGWTTSSGTITDCVTLAGCCPNSGAAASAVINEGPGIFDPVVPSLPINSPFPGNKVARVNNSATGAVVNRIEQSFMVSSSNAVFQIACASVLNSETAANHCCEDQPGLVINLKDSAGNTLSCPYLAFNAPSQCCPIDPSDTTWHPYTSGFTAGFYRGWKTQTIDLSPYIGSYITIQITVMDCAQTGHYGYSYIDCQCSPLEIDLNGTIFDATPQTPIDVSTCGSISALINAPTGLGPYLWNGPSGSGVTGITTQSISTTTPGTYTLTMSPDGSCAPGGSTIKYIILHVTPNPTVTNITAQATCTNATGSGTINATGGTSPYTYSWSPSASTSSLATGLSPGTDYTVTAIDTFGCRGTTIVSIASFTDAPTYTISPLSGNLTCLSPSLTVTANTDANTVAAWTHTATPDFTVTAPGTFSCVLTNTLSSCTATVPVTITTNTVAPVATPSISCNGSVVTLNATSGSGIALGWLAPTTPPSPVSNPGTSTATGVFTLTATNLTTGCKSVYLIPSLVPDLTYTTSPNITNLTCLNSAIQATTSTTTGNTTITWSNGVTTTTVQPYTISAAGTYTTMVSIAGGCSTQSVITITSNTVASINVTSTSTVIPCSTNSLAINVNGTSGGPYNYTWTAVPTSTNSVYNVSDAGTYTVVALNTANGCTTSATYTVSHETVDASFVASTYSGLMPLPVTFTNTSANATDYTWNYANGMPIDSTFNGFTTFNWQGDYAVVLTATKGYCTDTAVRIIRVELVSFLTIPNVFTPNGDRVNDEFVLSAINLGEITMTIFDRWGKKVFDSTANGTMKWDGKTKSGAEVADGTYFYIIKASGLDDKSYDYQGTVNIFR